MKHFLPVVLLLFLAPFVSNAQTAINTSFENYTTGNIAGQNSWTVTSGSGNITEDAYYVRTGSKALNIKTSATAMKIDQIAYSGTVPGLSGTVYVDLYVKIKDLQTSPFTIYTYDLFSSSSKKITMLEFLVNGKMKIYNGSSGNETLATYTKDTWTRVSLMINFATEKYKIALNGTVLNIESDFRDTYTSPAATGSRPAGKEFHSLRFNHNTDTGTGTSDIAIEDIYIGNTPISGVDFGDTTAKWKITATQPQVGSITVSPNQTEYDNNTSVTATLNIPQGYKNAGWTGDLSGTELAKTFSITKNMTIGADVVIDEGNPPAKYTVTVNQPSNGTITLNPTSQDSRYYAGTKVTASIQSSACYQFNGWTNDISGTALTNTFTVNGDMAIGASVTENTTPAVTRPVKNVSELNTALSAMNPGDTIELADGTYNISSGVNISRSGCESRGITIRAKNKGMAVLTGKVAFALKGVAYVTIEGLTINSSYVSTIFKMEGCNNVRITKNILRMSKDTETQTSKWVLIGEVYGNEICTSHHNRIDHNLFDGKSDGGAWLVIDGSHGTSPGDISKYDQIDHNHFRNNTPRANNEKETIRIGVTDLTPCKAYCTVEYNLFEDCDGDPEIVSLKSWNNTIRYNTFRRCLGTVCLRQGGENLVEGNYFFGEGKVVDGNGCGGVRVYGEKHRVINNYFEGLTGSKWDAACTITNGDAPVTSSTWNAHFIPKDVVFAFNTYVNNASNIEIGFSNSTGENALTKAPEGCVIANNIFIADSNPIVTVHTPASLAGVTFSNNIMYPTGSASIGMTTSAAQVTQTNPLLVQTTCRTFGDDCNNRLPYAVYKIQAGSPAIGAATGSYDYVTSDFEGQVRTGLKTIGADTYSNEPITTGALGPEHVGPDAIDFRLAASTYIPENKLNKPSVEVYSLSPDAIRLNFSSGIDSEALVNIYDIRGILCGSTSVKAATGSNSLIIPVNLAKGVYILELITTEYKVNTKFILR